jgi:hypothetical protein
MNIGHCSIRVVVAVGLGMLLGASYVEAQVDLSGSFMHVEDSDNQIRGMGPDYVNYTGIPLNADARAEAISYTPETINELNRECQPYKIHYLLLGAAGFRMWPTMDDAANVIAWSFSGSIDREPTTIWMDGRRPAATALATPGGFTSGVWQGNTLVTTTTHLQDGYLTRNGVPASDQEVLTMYWTRENNLLTVTGIIEDPVYLTEPYVLANTWADDPTRALAGPGVASPATCLPEEEVVSVLNGHVPSYLTAQDNPSLDYVTRLYNIPHATALGGAETMYPQYAAKLSSQYKPPANYCTHDCCGGFALGGAGGFLFNAQVLHCPGSGG